MPCNVVPATKKRMKMKTPNKMDKELIRNKIASLDYIDKVLESGEFNTDFARTATSAFFALFHSEMKDVVKTLRYYTLLRTSLDREKEDGGATERN